MARWYEAVGAAGLVVASLVQSGVEGPVLVEVAVRPDGSWLRMVSAPSTFQRAPVMSMRSLTTWRQAPSMTPVAMGQLFFAREIGRRRGSEVALRMVGALLGAGEHVVGGERHEREVVNKRRPPRRCLCGCFLAFAQWPP